MKFSTGVVLLSVVLSLTCGLAQFVACTPIGWSYRLTDACTWAERPWLRVAEPVVILGADLNAAMLGAPARGMRFGEFERAQVRECWVRSGWKGDGRDVRIFLTRWPAP